MASSQQSRVLRIGIIQDGRILEERHLRRGNVTLGQDGRSTLVLPLPGVPSSVLLFEYKNSQYRLVVTDELEGKLFLEGQVLDCQQVIAQGIGQAQGDRHVLTLPDGARGQLQLGPARLFFHITSAPVEPVRVELPPAVRGRRWQGMDRLFAGILAASLVVSFTLAVLIIRAERPVEPELALDELPDRFARVLMPTQAPPEPSKGPESAEASAAADKPSPEDSSSDKVEDAPAPSGEEAAAARRAEIARKVAGRGLLKILGSASGRSGGAFADVLGGSTGGGDIAAALAGASGGVGVATEASLGSGGPRGGSTGSAAGIGQLGTQGGGNVELGGKKEAQVSGIVRDATPEVESGDVDRNALVRFIKTRLRSIQSCYERELKRNPHLKGKLLVRFTIQPSGRASDIEIEENTLGNEGVASCIRTVIRGWVFPFKPDDEVPVSYPFLFSPAS